MSNEMKQKLEARLLDIGVPNQLIPTLIKGLELSFDFNGGKVQFLKTQNFIKVTRFDLKDYGTNF